MLRVLEFIFFIMIFINLKNCLYKMIYAINLVERSMVLLTMGISFLSMRMLLQVEETYQMLIVVAIMSFNKGLTEIIKVYRLDKIVDMIDENLKKIKR